VMYVLMLRPRRKQQQQQQAMIDRLRVGDDVLTTGGIYATVTQVEGDDVAVELAKGLEVHMTRRGIAAVLPPEEEEGEGQHAEDEGELVGAGASEAAAEVDEAGITADEEPIRSEADADTASADRR
jgi:preprotein translocase subunit YajC